MIKKTMRNAVAGTVAAGAMILPAATTVSPQIENMACNYPNSIVTTLKLNAPSVIRAHQRTRVVINVDAGGFGPNGKVRFRVVKAGHVKRTQWTKVSKGSPVVHHFGKGFKAGKRYKLRAKFFGNCRFRNSADQKVITVLHR